MGVDEHVASRLKDISEETFTGINIDGLHVLDAVKFRHAFVGSSFAILVVLVGCCISADPDKNQVAYLRSRIHKSTGYSVFNVSRVLATGIYPAISDCDTFEREMEFGVEYPMS